MDIQTINHLCNLSKLNYSDEEKIVVMGEMSEIINLMDTVKGFDVVYDDTKDNNMINFEQVREDIPENSYPTDKLLSNTKPQNNCYVVPKMVD